MAYIKCNHCGKKFEELNASGIKKVNCVWCDEPLKKNSQKKAAQRMATGIGANEVVVTDISMSFGSMVAFMVKWGIASIPAVIILLIIYFCVLSLIGLLFYSGESYLFQTLMESLS